MPLNIEANLNEVWAGDLDTEDLLVTVEYLVVALYPGAIRKRVLLEDKDES